MRIEAHYLGMPLVLNERESHNAAYFRYCAAHEFRLQRCRRCGRCRYPPGTGCPWCAEPESDWHRVYGSGTVHSYMEVHKAIQPAFQAHVPFLILLVELDFQKADPTEHEALRIVGNLTTADGALAPPEIARTVGIGTRVRMVFTDVAARLSLPQWTIDERAVQPTAPWRYPD